MKRSPLRIFLLVGLLGLVGVFSWYGMRGYHAWKRRQALNKPWVHKFQEPSRDRPIPPRFSILGLYLGESMFSQVQVLTKKLGLSCKDNSVRGMMRRQRAARIAKLRAQGKVDGISGASWNRPSPRERNPAIRWNCEKVPSFKLQDIARPAGLSGRWLFVFDSEKHPLRHLSYQYDAKPQKAVAAFRAVVAHYQKLLGKPTLQKDDRPLFSATSQPTALGASLLSKVRKFDRFRRVWQFGGLRVQVTLRSFDRWFNLSELVEVPWPIRPDAPVSLRKKK